MAFLGNATPLIVMRLSRDPLRVSATLAVTVLIIGSLLLASNAAKAQLERPQTDLMAKEFDTKVITVGDMINRGLWSLAREVFDHEATARIGQAPIDPKPRGVEFLLFTPGTFGATIRYRW